MALWLFELFFIILFIALAIWIGLRPFERNMRLCFEVMLKSLACYGFCLPLAFLTQHADVSLTVIINACLLVSSIMWFCLGLVIRPVCKRHQVQRQRYGVVGNVVLIALLLMLSVTALDILAMAIPRSVLLTSTTQSYILKPLAKTHEDKASEQQQRELQQVIDQQSQLFSRITQQAQQSRQWFYQVTGIDQIVKQVGALQEILSLSHAQRAQIINQSHELTELTHHPLILQIVNDEALVKLITQAGEGHMPAVWQLKKHPAITDLLNDKQLHDQMLKLDLHRILKAHRESQWDRQSLLPVIWYSTVLQSPGELQTALQTPTGWQKSGPSLRWDMTVNHAAITAEFHAKPQTHITVRCETAAKLKAYVDDQPVSVTVKVDDKTHQLTLISQGKPISLCLQLDWQSSNTQRTCNIQVSTK
ncbi:MAG: hypothetical protein CMJ19_22425 [Phycisphaeraceae bacterium]|nr:hypothetical protein [Phycisphaeraceae bacterium]